MIYKRGQQIVGVITNVTDEPRRGISYTITSGTESFVCSDFHETNFTLNTIESYDPFENYMNPPEEEEELYNVCVNVDKGTYNCKDVRSTYIDENGFLIINYIDNRVTAIKLDNILVYEMVPQKKEGKNEGTE